MAGTTLTAAQQAAQNQQNNLLARQAVLSAGVRMKQPVFTGTFTPANTPVVNIQPRPVGLIVGFIVECQATVTNNASAGVTLTDFGPANLFSNIGYWDLNNYNRISAPGWYMEFLNTQKSRRVFGSSIATDSPINYGSHWGVISAPSTLAASASGTINMRFFVPLAFDGQDLRGAVYSNVLNATQTLSFTFNPAPFVASGDSTQAIYTGNTGTLNSVTMTVTQVYIDQIPQGQNGPILPWMDLGQAYEIKQTALTGMAAGQDFPVPFSNFRLYQSTTLVYYNGSARATGADLNYIALQSANFTNIWKLTPATLAMLSRNAIGTDFPPGVYYCSHREKPISTLQYGNMELVLNAITAGAGAYVLVGWESMSQISTVPNAGSLSAG